MKPYLLLLSVFAVGCMRYPSSPPGYDRLANLPTEPHHREVTILFPTDPLPSAPYLRVGMLEARGGQYTSYNELIRELQLQGQELGVDAVQLFDKQYIEETGGSEVIDTYVSSTLSGLGILYVENAAYLRQYVQAKELYGYNDSTQQYDRLVCRTALSYDGTPPSIAGNVLYAGFFTKYDLDHLYYEETDDWRYSIDQYGRVDQRSYRPQGTLRKKCKFTFNTLGQITEVRIRYIASPPWEERMQLQYDEAGQVIEKTIVRPGFPTLREIPAYDGQGRQVGSEFLRAIGEQFQPYLRLMYRFFDPDKLPTDGSLVKANP